MKSQTPLVYANYVITQHLRKDMCYKSATIDAIIDVENTIKGLGNLTGIRIDFFNEVLTILKNKL